MRAPREPPPPAAPAVDPAARAGGVALIERCPAAAQIRFGPAGGSGDDGLEYTLDPESLELSHRGQRVDLRPRALQVLAILVRQEGRLVTIAELRRALWGDLHLDWRNGLHRCICDLRRSLSDDPRHPLFVETVARLGYRFVGERLAPRAPGPQGVASAAASRSARAWRRPSLAFLAGFAAAALLPAALLLACALAAGLNP